MVNKLYTKTEINFIIDNYHICHISELSKRLSRTENSIAHKANRLGLYKKCRWSQKSIKFLENHYLSMSYKDMSKVIHKSEKAIHIKCSRLSLIDYNGKYKNGILYSHPQEQICKWVNGELNYRLDNFYVDVALISNKIAIEYDEWYWHKSKFIKDIKRVNKLLNQGWKVITVRASDNLPNKQDLFNAIKNAKKSQGKYWHIITLEGWGE